MIGVDEKHGRSRKAMIGMRWARPPLLRVPSAIVPPPASPEVNFLINHNHPATTEIKISRLESFVCDPCFCEPRIDVMEWPTSFGGVR